MAAEDHRFSMSVVFDKGKTKVSIGTAKWEISDCLTFRRHDACLYETVDYKIKVTTPTDFVLWLVDFESSSDAKTCLETVVEFLKQVDERRQKAYYTRCTVGDLEGDFFNVTREDDPFVHNVHKIWIPLDCRNPGDSFLVLRSLFDYRGPADLHPIVSLGSNVVAGKAYPQKLTKRIVNGDGTVHECYCPDMNATPRVIVTGKTYSDECLDF